jgi:hypothetical protein
MQWVQNQYRSVDSQMKLGYTLRKPLHASML